jgi:hypothetical protein
LNSTTASQKTITKEKTIKVQTSLSNYQEAKETTRCCCNQIRLQTPFGYQSRQWGTETPFL